eukprot:1181904-Prorocentrum_minimum.AAC.1
MDANSILLSIAAIEGEAAAQDGRPAPLPRASRRASHPARQRAARQVRGRHGALPLVERAEQRNSGSVEQRISGTADQWNSGPEEQWNSGSDRKADEYA